MSVCMVVPADVVGAGPAGDDFLFLLTGLESTGEEEEGGEKRELMTEGVEGKG